MKPGRIEAMGTRPLLLGHRGARSDRSVPENTLAAFDLALSSGCDGFEFDVRLSADGQAVLCHDAVTGADRLEIAKCSAKDLQLPTLKEVLARYQRAAFLDIELKAAGLEKMTSQLIGKFPPQRGYVVSSFLPEVLESLCETDKQIPLGLICENQLQMMRWHELDVEYVIPHFKLVHQDLIAEVKSQGKKILVWTVNSSSDMKRFASWGVNGIVSDNPRALVRNLGASTR